MLNQIIYMLYDFLIRPQAYFLMVLGMVLKEYLESNVLLKIYTLFKYSFLSRLTLFISDTKISLNG